MTDPLDTQIAEIRALIESQLRVKGRDLRQQTRRAGRLIPRRRRKDLRYLLEAQKLAENPKLALMIDRDKAAKAHGEIVKFLEKQDPRARMWDRVINIAASVGLVIVVVIVLVIYVLWARGFV